jgi:hypothetical protein
MPKAKGTSDRLLHLSTKAAKLQEEIQRLRVLESKQELKREERRKTLVGSAVLALVERGEWSSEQLLAVLDKHLTRPRDRDLFSLPVDPRPSTATASEAQPES